MFMVQSNFCTKTVRIKVYKKEDSSHSQENKMILFDTDGAYSLETCENLREYKTHEDMDADIEIYLL